MKKGLCMLLASAMIFGSMAGGIVEAKAPVEVPQIPVTETFSDIYNDWYTEYVQYVYDTGLMSGMQGTKNFAPNANISKAQVAQVLYNLEGKPEVSENPVFSELKDVYEAEWYAKAVSWAYNTGIVTGDTNAMKFFPNADVTREQLGLMMYRFAQYKTYDVTDSSDLEGLKNAENTANWAMDGVKWAVGVGLISGVEKNGVKDLEPQKTASRAQMAAILKRFDGTYLRNSDAVEGNGHSYKIFRGEYTWEEAKAKCEKSGGHLATITSQEEQELIDQLNVYNDELWIGGYRGDDHVWKWVTGEPWSYTHWGEEEPNNSSNVIGNENRVALWPDGWNDLNEKNMMEQNGFICEWDSGDYVVEETDHVYQVFVGRYTWTEAKAMCEKMGGHLATITTEEEEELINRINEEGYTVWIGGYREDDYIWRWVTGEVWEYTNWCEGEPNDSVAVVANENRVVTQGYGWNDLNDENTEEQQGFLCEWDSKQDMK